MAIATPTWLNLEYVEGILRASEADNSIRVIDIFVKPATSTGDNYTSDMLRVNVEFTRKQGDENVTEKLSIIVKIAPIAEGIRKELVKDIQIFDVEISMMTNTLKKMNALLKPEHRLNGRIYHVQKEDPVHLVIEDLATLGYRMADRQAGLNMHHCVLAIRGLARFHASSVAVCEKEPKMKKLYTKGMFSKDYPPDMTTFFTSGPKLLAAEVANWPDLGPRYSEKIMNIADHLYDKGCESVTCREDEFNVINHGDFWVNNMLFKYDESGNPVSHIFVDFQMCIYTSPAIDLHYFLSTSLTDDVLGQNKTALLEEYLSTLTATMKQLNCQTTPPTMEELKKNIRERAIYGMIAAFTVLPIVRIDKSEAKGLDDMLSKDGAYTTSAYKNKNYRKVIEKLIPEYDEMGLLDF